MNNPQGREMEEFKQEVRNDFRELTRSVNKLAESMSTMATSVAITEEQKKHQDRINNELQSDVSELKSDLTALKLERAEEKQSRTFLMKYWPWMMVFVVIITGIITAVASGIGRNLVS